MIDDIETKSFKGLVYNNAGRTLHGVTEYDNDEPVTEYIGETYHFTVDDVNDVELIEVDEGFTHVKGDVEVDIEREFLDEESMQVSEQLGEIRFL